MTATTETRGFRLHPSIFYNLVLRQAGTLQKAILELVMNSVDAKATKCVIEVTEDCVIVRDDGEGFRSRDEIENFFEVFGQPPEEGVKKTYGQFRIGRGQAFAFGKNRWRSGAFEMNVDIKGKGTDYELQDNLESAKGCEITIKLYEPLLPSAYEETIHALAHWVQYAPIKVKINGKTVNKDPATQKWDVETDDAYIKFAGSEGLDVYNLGIFVLSLSRWQYGTGGVILSKHQLKVNFARNDIQADCPVWQRVKPVIDQRTTNELTKKKSLDDDQRAALIKKITERKLKLDHQHGFSLKILTAVTGRHYPLSVLFPSSKTIGLAVGPKGDIKACRVHEDKRAFVLAQSVLDAFGVDDCKELLQLLQDRNSYTGEHYGDRFNFTKLPILDLATLTAGIRDETEVVDKAKLVPREQIWIKLIELTGDQSFGEQRRYVVGKSQTLQAWTDGQTYVALNRDFLKEQPLTIPGFSQVGAVLLHCLCHDAPDTDGHEHDTAFYERFHDRLENNQLGLFIDDCVRYLPRVCRQMDRKMSKRSLRSQDNVVAATRAEAQSTAAATDTL